MSIRRLHASLFALVALVPGGAWATSRLSSEGPASSAQAAASPPEVERVALTQILRTSLRNDTSAGTGPIRDVVYFEVHEDGSFELVRRDPRPGLSFARVTSRGELDFESDLSSTMPAGSSPIFHRLRGDRWLIQMRDQEPPWRELDVRTAEMRPCPLLDGASDAHVAALDDGGYVALLNRLEGSAAFTELARVRTDGTLAWKEEVGGLGPDASAFQRALGGARELVRIDGRELALLAGSDIVVFDLERQVRRRVALGAALGREPGYVGGLRADGKGGVLIEENDALHHFDSSGVLLRTLRPRRPDGSGDSALGFLARVAPDGRIWTSDRTRLFRLGDDGLADLALGAALDVERLTRIAAVEIDVRGRVLVQDASSLAVHVFDDAGQRLTVCRLDPTEREDSIRDGLRGASDGSVWVATKRGLARFDERGARVETLERAQGEPDHHWSMVGARVRLDEFDPQRRGLASIELRPDGSRLDWVSARRTLADGRRVLLARTAADGRWSAVLHVYGADMAPQETLRLPVGVPSLQLAIGTRWLVAGSYGPKPAWALVRLLDSRCLLFEPELPDGDWTVGVSADGRRILAVDRESADLATFALP